MILKKLQNSKDLRNIGEIFNEGGKEQDEVIRVGEKALLLLYSNKIEETLDGLWHKNFLDKVLIKLGQVEPNSQPPTSSSAKYHSLCAYLQVQKWKNMHCEMSPEEWGWIKDNQKYVPLGMDLPPAPEELMKVVRCTCNMDCSKRTCTCRKYQRKCSTACLNCRGLAYTNAEAIISEDLPGAEWNVSILVYLNALVTWVL